ncbi:MAG: hypothetical protein LBL92_04655, partial [Propionibacteriaceae bacterium]|nr:hypothetical protein [Propionibacteriaceae bacterium]
MSDKNGATDRRQPKGVEAEPVQLAALPWFGQTEAPAPLSPVAAVLSRRATYPVAKAAGVGDPGPQPAATPMGGLSGDPARPPLWAQTDLLAKPEFDRPSGAMPSQSGVDHLLKASFLTAAEPASGQAGESVSDSDIDWAAVAQLRADAAQRLSTWPGQSELTEQERHTVGRNIITDLLGERAADLLRAGQPAWAPAAELATAQAVFDMLFGLGRIQPLVDDPAIEDIYITGSDPTWLTFFGQPPRPGPAVADSDQELIDFLAFIASRSDPPRSFSPAQPN